MDAVTRILPLECQSLCEKVRNSAVHLVELDARFDADETFPDLTDLDRR